MTCSGSSPSAGISCASARVGAVGGLVGGATVRAEVGPAVVVPLVAEDRGPHRVALEDALPEAVGEVVDGGVRIEGDGHRRALPMSAFGGQAASVAPRRLSPKRSASRAGGVSSSWS